MKRILLVEDNTDLRNLIVYYLCDDYKVSTASNAANLFVKEMWEDIDIALVDYMMPGITGDQLIYWLAVNVPHVARVLLTASVPEAIPAEAKTQAYVFYKPSAIIHLKEMLTLVSPKPLV